MHHCYSCELVARRDAGRSPLWDCIYRGRYWDVAHALNTALPGWLVLIARRHIAAVADMTEEEAIELGSLLGRVSAALQEVTGCIKTYVIQFAESANHPHVHFHLIPRLASMPEERHGPRVFKYLEVSVEDQVSEEVMNDVAARIQRLLLDW